MTEQIDEQIDQGRGGPHPKSLSQWARDLKTGFCSLRPEGEGPGMRVLSGGEVSRLLVILIAVLITLAAIVPARAQGPAPTTTPRPVSDNEVNRVSKGLYCPVCQNVPLEVCETQACSRWREQVRDLLAQGYTEDQVRAYFVERFGAQTVGVPTNPIGQVLTFALPLALIALIGGGIALGLFLRRSRTRAAMVDTPGSQSSGANTTDDYRARLEDELRKRE